ARQSGPLPEDFFATLKAAANVKPAEDEDFFASLIASMNAKSVKDEDNDKDTDENESTIPAS
ncbi:hypothetical protein Tco_1387258, partial [Tanacetum coccineum]